MTSHHDSIDQEAQVLIPYDPREAMCLKHAADRADKSETTIRNWCRDYSIGRQLVTAGPWEVSRVALEMFLDGNRRVLKAYLAGDRSSAMVMQYFERTGVLHDCSRRKSSPDSSCGN